MILLIVFIALLFVLSLVAQSLDRTIITAPLLFTFMGMAISVLFPDLRSPKLDPELFRHVAEVGLVLLLFTDASRVDLAMLKRSGKLPFRLLSTGMLLTIALGALLAWLIIPGLSIWEAGILGAILAPTDAGLGQVIVSSPRVPERIRQALNVEAGLNDGLSVPFLLFFIGLAGTQEAHEAGLMRLMMEQLGLGALIGVVIGLAGGYLLEFARRTNLTNAMFLQIGLVTLPLLCALASEVFHASMFIAAFVAGLAVQVGFKQAGQHSIDFAEGWGQLFNLAVFFLFGNIVINNLPNFTLPILIYSILSLTVIRMLPVAIALAGTGLSRPTVGFMGWFGPRGLASIVLGLVYMGSETHLPGEHSIVLAVILTVVLSIFLHGLTALPGAKLYAQKISGLAADSPEKQGGFTGREVEI